MPYNATMSRQDAQPDRGHALSRATTGAAPPMRSPAPGLLSLPDMLYPNSYTWFVFFSALDIMLTWAILRRGGHEVNPLADRVIESWGLAGAILFKFSLTILVVIVCEVVGRQKPKTGKALAVTAMLVSAVPVCYSMLLLLMHTMEP